MKKKYELILIFVSGTSKKEIKEAVSGLKLILDKEKAVIKKEENLGSMDLKYHIKKQDKGDFWVLQLESEKGLGSEKLSVYLEREKRIIRYLFLKGKN